MDRRRKEEVVAELRDKLVKAKSVVVTDYKGLKAPEIGQLRKTLKDQGVDYRVIKNTLMRLASKDTDAAALEPLIEGTCAIAISYDDPVISAKLLRDFARENEYLKIKGGFLQSQVLEAKDVIALADIPSREVLLGQLLGVLNGIPTSLVSVLSAVPRSMVTVLSAIKQKKEEQQ